MANIKIAILNPSTVVKDADVQSALPAFQSQVSDDFAPVWGIDADLRLVPQGGKPNSGEWWIAILDDSDQAGALGYHDLTTDGLPLGKVFAKTDLTYGENWTVTTSHELLEMLADPNINLTVFDESQSGGRLYAYEVCDPCEADAFAYEKSGDRVSGAGDRGAETTKASTRHAAHAARSTSSPRNPQPATRNPVMLSDFVYPSWFEAFRTAGSTRFDHQNQIQKPFQLLKGGYIGIYDIRSGSGWTQLTAEKNNFRARPPVGARRERRTIPADKRIRSTVKF
jgi:hypothetical protein